MLLAVIDLQSGCATDTRLAHAARDHGCVRRHATVRGQHARGLDETVDVVGRRLPADEDHALSRLTALLGRVRVEHDVS